MEDVGEGIESRIQQAMRSRIQYFRDQADSLTFEGVRRLLEKDLNLDIYALDVHKRYVKQMLEKYLNSKEDENASKDSGQTKVEQVKEQDEERPEEHSVKEDIKAVTSEDEEKMEDSPVMGLLSGNGSSRSENLETRGNKKKDVASEAAVKKAIWRRATYLRSKSEEITVAGVRRLLEEDLELEKYSLDIHKKLISNQLDEVINSPEIPETATPVKKKTSVSSRSKKPNQISSKGSNDSSGNDSENIENEVKSKKKLAPKGSVDTLEGPKKRKRPPKEPQRSRKKQNKHAEETSEEKNTEEGEDVSEDEKSQSSAEKPVKKKEVVTPAYGKKVEHLKQIIKSCGMSVAPSIYKKTRQVSEDKREAFIIKELQEILSKEGLSTNPTEKEIKEVKRRKERAKELEGIDTSNIVLSSRRRSTAIFVAPPKPKLPVESDGDGSEDSEDGENDDSDDEEEDEDDNGNDSQGEEVNEDTDDSD